MTSIRPGARYYSVVCETEVIVIRCAGSVDGIECGGKPMADVVPKERESLPVEHLSGGTQLGKRYADEGGTLEVLCTKGGAGALSVSGMPLTEKAAKPLPSSD
jgi:hypothetical protein